MRKIKATEIYKWLKPYTAENYKLFNDVNWWHISIIYIYREYKITIFDIVRIILSKVKSYCSS